MAYSRGALVRAARAAGFVDVSERMVTEWGQLGLLDVGERASRRDGTRGAYYEWPENQLSLLLSLLGLRSQVRQPRALVVVPVGVWLYWGDEWIRTRQVHRALRTSMGLFGPSNSWERAIANARQVVAALRAQGAPRADLTKLREALTTGLYSRQLDAAALRPLVAAVMQAGAGGATWGPFGWDPDQVVDMLRVMCVGINHIEDATDAELVEARDRLRASVLRYLASWRDLTKLPDWGHAFERPTLDMLIERSCRDLIGQLGIHKLADEEGRLLPAPSITGWQCPPLHLLPLRASLQRPSSPSADMPTTSRQEATHVR